MVILSTKKCSRGHTYNSSYSECPFCKALGVSELIDSDPHNIIDILDPPAYPVPKTKAVEEQTEKTETEDNVTQVLIRSENSNNDPVVGWLVCTKGAEYGKGLALHADNNFVGSAPDQDIQLADPKISSSHFSVGFDSENNVYFIFMQSGAHGIVSINGKLLKETTILQAGDKIQVGDTELVFIPLDQKFVKWD